MLPRVFGSRVEGVPGGLSACAVVRVAAWLPSRPEVVALDWPGDDVRAVIRKPMNMSAVRSATTTNPVTRPPQQEQERGERGHWIRARDGGDR